MSYSEGHFYVKELLESHLSLGPCHLLDPISLSYPWPSLMYSFGHYSMSRTTQSYEILFDRQ